MPSKGLRQLCSNNICSCRSSEIMPTALFIAQEFTDLIPFHRHRIPKRRSAIAWEALGGQELKSRAEALFNQTFQPFSFAPTLSCNEIPAMHDGEMLIRPLGEHPQLKRFCLNLQQSTFPTQYGWHFTAQCIEKIP